MLWLALHASAWALDSLPPNIQSVLLNIGSNLDPVLPPSEDESIAAIAFEPLVAAAIKPHPRLYVVPAAVSSSHGLAMMDVLNRHGVSSSLSKHVSKPFARAAWATSSVPARVVPVITMLDVLNSIPSSISIMYLKTDMQGYDFNAVQSAGKALTRVPYVMTEVYLQNRSTYANVSNDFCNDWLPHMLKIGYIPRSLSTYSGIVPHMDTAQAQHYCANHKRANVDLTDKYTLTEGDAIWVLKGTSAPAPCFNTQFISKLGTRTRVGC